MILRNLKGQRFGKLVVLRRVHVAPARTHWLCKCDCGETSKILAQNLTKGRTTSCGCGAHMFKLKHGQTRSYTWSAWQDMRSRCLSVNNSAYKNNGARGLKVCPEWDSFEQFYADMGERPKGTWLGWDVFEKGYCKENCHWRPYRVNGHNVIAGISYEYEGKTQSLVNWAKEKCLTYSTLKARWYKGLRGAALFARPKRKGRPPKLSASPGTSGVAAPSRVVAAAGCAPAGSRYVRRAV